MLQAIGNNILTPFSLQAAIMNGTDPSPQDVTIQNGLFTGHSVKVFAYNQQVTDPLTKCFLGHSRRRLYRSSGSTRRCPRQAIAIRPGWWPKSPPSQSRKRKVSHGDLAEGALSPDDRSEVLADLG